MTGTNRKHAAVRPKICLQKRQQAIGGAKIQTGQGVLPRVVGTSTDSRTSQELGWLPRRVALTTVVCAVGNLPAHCAPEPPPPRATGSSTMPLPSAAAAPSRIKYKKILQEKIMAVKGADMLSYDQADDEDDHPPCRNSSLTTTGLALADGAVP
eukprot:g25542.t1